MPLDAGSRIFTVGELWGPMKCEEKVSNHKCGKEAWAILLTAEENASLPEESGPEAVTFIFKKGIGVALCEEHTPK